MPICFKISADGLTEFIDECEVVDFGELASSVDWPLQIQDYLKLFLAGHPGVMLPALRIEFQKKKNYICVSSHDGHFFSAVYLKRSFVRDWKREVYSGTINQVSEWVNSIQVLQGTT